MSRTWVEGLVLRGRKGVEAALLKVFFCRPGFFGFRKGVTTANFRPSGWVRRDPFRMFFGLILGSFFVPGVPPAPLGTARLPKVVPESIFRRFWVSPGWALGRPWDTLGAPCRPLGGENVTPELKKEAPGDDPGAEAGEDPILEWPRPS